MVEFIMCTSSSITLHRLMSGMRVRRCIVDRFKNIIRICILLPVIAFAAGVQAQDLGRVLSNEELELLPRHVFADGQGLPQGQGVAEHGFELYAQHCAACHGGRGEGGRHWSWSVTEACWPLSTLIAVLLFTGLMHQRCLNTSSAQCRRIILIR